METEAISQSNKTFLKMERASLWVAALLEESLK